MAELGAVFDRIYRENAWAGEESRSGPGSGRAATAWTAIAVRMMAVAVGAHTVVDMACGDGYWQPELPGYVGLDVSAEAIARARELHPERTFRVFDPAIHRVPRGDLVLCRDAIHHLPAEEGHRLLGAIRASGTPWLLATTYVGGELGLRIAPGEAYSPDLEHPQWGLGPALLLVRDGWDYEVGSHVRDARKMLGLWHLGV